VSKAFVCLQRKKGQKISGYKCGSGHEGKSDFLPMDRKDSGGSPVIYGQYQSHYQ
jgi:hypothetical protein